EEAADGFASCAELDRAVRHRLPGDAADELTQHAFVGSAKAVRDIVTAVDPARLDVRQPAVADEVAEQLAEPFAPPLRQTLVRGGPTTFERPRKRFDLHRQDPRGAGCGSR